MPLERAGGQAQFITYQPTSADGTSLEPLMRWIQVHLRQPLTLERLASHAATSTRMLSRRFTERTGTTPLQWILLARVRRAQQLLETTRHSVERIATEVGFGAAPAFRDRFNRIVGTSPQRYRRAFRR